MILKTGADGSRAVLPSGICGQCDRGQGALLALLEGSQFSDERIAVFTGHSEVANQHVGSCRANTLHRFRRGACCRNRGSGNLQHPFHQFARIDIVVHHQYVNIGEGYIWKSLARLRRCLEMATFLSKFRINGPQGETDGKGCSFPNPTTSDADVATMEFDKLLDYSQSQAKSAMVTSYRRISLKKTVKHIRQKLGGDALTGINDVNFNVM